MNRLVVIQDDDEEQARRWVDISRQLGVETHVLNSSELGNQWNFESSHLGSYIETKGKQFHLDNRKNCFYWRAPFYGNYISDSLPMILLWEMLHLIAYKSGGFFTPPDCRKWDHCKTFNLMLAGTYSYPATHWSNALPFDVDAKNTIVKAISGMRTEVVKLSNPDLLLGRGDRTDSAILLQEYVAGFDIKINAYRTRHGKWLHFATKVNPTEKIDFRFSDNFSIEKLCIEARWIEHSEYIFNATGARFFDFDLRRTEIGEDYFLEANFSPAQISAEDMLPDYDNEFTKELLKDWVKLS